MFFTQNIFSLSKSCVVNSHWKLSRICLKSGPRWWQAPFMPCHHLGPQKFLFVEVTQLPTRRVTSSPLKDCQTNDGFLPLLVRSLYWDVLKKILETRRILLAPCTGLWDNFKYFCYHFKAEFCIWQKTKLVKLTHLDPDLRFWIRI